MRLPASVPATLLMVMVAPVDELNVQTVGFAVGARVNVRFWASGAVVRLALRPGSAIPEKAAPSSRVTGLSWIPLVAVRKTLIIPLAGSKARSRLSVIQRWRTGSGTEPFVAGLLPARYSVRLLKPSPSASA